MSEGCVLFLFESSDNGKKEYIFNRLAKVFFEIFHIESIQLDLFQEENIAKLEQIDSQFHSFPPEKKHFLFTLDGDALKITLKMNGRWVDLVRYNVFSYFTKSPYHLLDRITGINSWYIALLTTSETASSFIEKTSPQLDGTESMLFPGFKEKYANLSISDRQYDIFFISDSEETPEQKYIIENWKSEGYSVLIYSEASFSFQEMLFTMGKSKISFFIHQDEYERNDIRILSAMINGSVVFTENTNTLTETFHKDEIYLYSVENACLAPKCASDLLKNPCKLLQASNAGKKKAENIGNISDFCKKLLDRCK